MRVDPWLAKGTVIREWYEFSVRIEKVKREFMLLFGIDRGVPMARRRKRRDDD